MWPAVNSAQKEFCEVYKLETTMDAHKHLHDIKIINFAPVVDGLEQNKVLDTLILLLKEGIIKIPQTELPNIFPRRKTLLTSSR